MGDKCFLLQLKQNKFEIPEHAWNNGWIAFTLEQLEKNEYNLNSNDIMIDNLLSLGGKSLNKIIDELNLFNTQTTLTDFFEVL